MASTISLTIVISSRIKLHRVTCQLTTFLHGLALRTPHLSLSSTVSAWEELKPNETETVQLKFTTGDFSLFSSERPMLSET